jgi:hypothetical protein
MKDLTSVLSTNKYAFNGLFKEGELNFGLDN